ncbi:MAG: glycosyltransferase, partial [Bacteroidia bacterium]|nr:glycosyltransferase [Bacteroidia bacterium]
FPFGSQETFLEYEIEILSKRFNQVVIIPVIQKQSDSDVARPIPSNCTVWRPTTDEHARVTYLSVAFFLLGKVWKEAFSWKWGPSFWKIKSLKHLVKSTSRLLATKSDWERWMRQLTELGATPIISSYWLNSWLLFPLAWRERNKASLLIVSRAHNYDLYHKRAFGHYHHFRPWLFKRLDGIYSDSQAGSDYMASLYDRHSAKFKTAYLGVPDPITLNPNNTATQGSFRIICTANLIPLKRVDMVVEALALQQTNIRFDLFGDGPERGKIEAIAADLPANIDMHLHGRVGSPHIQQWYQEEPVDLFVLTSTYEGLPVSIMEAFSYGVPCLATDVGGVSEAINGKNGWVLPADLTPEILADHLAKFIALGEAQHEAYRQAARATFDRQFSAEKNYRDYHDELISISPKHSPQ